MSDRGLETLLVWQRALAFAVKVCSHVVPSLPTEEKWVLSQQLRRAAQSIPANIAEAYDRYHYQDSIRFCYIARGSIEETYSHIRFANEMKFLSQDKYDELIKDIQEIRKMLNGYIAFLRKNKRSIIDQEANLSILNTSLPDDQST